MSDTLLRVIEDPTKASSVPAPMLILGLSYEHTEDVVLFFLWMPETSTL